MPASAQRTDAQQALFAGFDLIDNTKKILAFFAFLQRFSQRYSGVQCNRLIFSCSLLRCIHRMLCRDRSKHILLKCASFWLKTYCFLQLGRCSAAGACIALVLRFGAKECDEEEQEVRTSSSSRARPWRAKSVDPVPQHDAGLLAQTPQTLAPPVTSTAGSVVLKCRTRGVAVGLPRPTTYWSPLAGGILGRRAASSLLPKRELMIK